MSLDITLSVRQLVPVVEKNITHNCRPMAVAAGLRCLWRPEEHGILIARDLIEPLEKGLKLMSIEGATFIALNPTNGWGNLVDFMQWCEELLRACEAHPSAEVSVCV